MKFNLRGRFVAEFLGTAFLVAGVIGSGIMGEKLAGGNVAVALLANTLATGAILVALILALAPISGAHLNPAVTLAMSWDKALPWPQAIAYVAAQVLGAFAGTITAHRMFALRAFSVSTHPRHGLAQWWSEFVATFGLLLVVRSCARFRSSWTAVAVGAYITAAYWFTASTSFANPAVTLARTASNTFTGIRPVDAPAFVVAQLIGAFAATALFRWPAPSQEVASAQTAVAASARGERSNAP